MDEAKEKQVIACMNALELYREMLSDLDQTQFDKIWDEVKLQYKIQQNRGEMKMFLTKLGESYFQKKVNGYLMKPRMESLSRVTLKPTLAIPTSTLYPKLHRAVAEML